MADTFKILEQNTPSANVLTDLYTVPGGTQAVISSICICNQTVGMIAFRISVAQAGASDDSSQYLYWDVPMQQNDSFVATLGISLSAGDIIRVRADNTPVSFNVFGVEVT